MAKKGHQRADVISVSVTQEEIRCPNKGPRSDANIQNGAKFRNTNARVDAPQRNTDERVGTCLNFSEHDNAEAQ